MIRPLLSKSQPGLAYRASGGAHWLSKCPNHSLTSKADYPNLRDEDLPLIPLRDLRRVSRLEKERQRFHQITPRLFDGIALAGDIELRASAGQSLTAYSNSTGKCGK